MIGISNYFQIVFNLFSYFAKLAEKIEKCLVEKVATNLSRKKLHN